MINAIFNKSFDGQELKDVNVEFSNIEKNIGCTCCFKYCMEQGFKKFYYSYREYRYNREFYEQGADWEICCLCEKPTCNRHYTYDQYGDICRKCWK